MTYKYYEAKSEEETKFDIGDVLHLTLEKKKEKYDGLFIRKLSLATEGKGNEPPFKVVHIQETMWADNTSPDHNNLDEGNKWFERVNYILKKIKKMRTLNPTSKVLVHCR